MTPNGGGIPEAFAVPDATNDILEAPSHGFSNANMVVVWTVPGVSLPTGLAEGTVYHVRDVTTDDLKLAATVGGAAIDITAVGAGFLQKIVEETYGSQGTHTVTTLTMSED
jgi:nitrate/nitrite transporter NarK